MRAREHLAKVAGMIAVKSKSLTLVQGVYENMVNRKTFWKPLQLQNHLVRKILKAINVDFTDVKASPATCLVYANWCQVVSKHCW